MHMSYLHAGGSSAGRRGGTFSQRDVGDVQQLLFPTEKTKLRNVQVQFKLNSHHKTTKPVKHPHPGVKLCFLPGHISIKVTVKETVCFIFSTVVVRFPASSWHFSTNQHEEPFPWLDKLTIIHSMHRIKKGCFILKLYSFKMCMCIHVFIWFDLICFHVFYY